MWPIEGDWGRNHICGQVHEAERPVVSVRAIGATSMRPKLSVRVNLTSPLFPELKAGGKDAAQRRAPPLFDADLGEPFFPVGFGEQRREQADCLVQRYGRGARLFLPTNQSD
jgi:hypothetical protein